MNLPGGTTISPITLGAIVATCAAPAITLNVWPRVETMLSQGLTSNELGTALLVGVSAFAMTTIPFAMAKAPNRGFWLTSLAFGISLGALNYIMAVGAIGKVADHATAEATAQISRLASLKDQLEELRAARKELGTFRPTSAEAVRAADEAVKLAEAARLDECAKVADHCRARVAQLQSRLSERAELVGALSLTARGAVLDKQIDEVRTRLGQAGAVPLSTNPQADRIRTIIAWFKPSIATESVATGIIHFLAIMSELFAFLGPRVLATALARHPQIPKRETGRLGNEGAAKRVNVLSLVKRPFLLAKGAGNRPAQLPDPHTAAHSRTIFAGAIALPPGPRGAGPKPEATNIWFEQKVVKKPGNRIRCWEAYKSYEKWCKEHKADILSFTAFDFGMTSSGIRKEPTPRSTYIDIEVI